MCRVPEGYPFRWEVAVRALPLLIGMALGSPWFMLAPEYRVQAQLPGPELHPLERLDDPGLVVPLPESLEVDDDGEVGEVFLATAGCVTVHGVRREGPDRLVVTLSTRYHPGYVLLRLRSGWGSVDSEFAWRQEVGSTGRIEAELADRHRGRMSQFRLEVLQNVSIATSSLLVRDASTDSVAIVRPDPAPPRPDGLLFSGRCMVPAEVDP